MDVASSSLTPAAAVFALNLPGAPTTSPVLALGAMFSESPTGVFISSAAVTSVTMVLETATTTSMPLVTPTTHIDTVPSTKAATLGDEASVPQATTTNAPPQNPQFDAAPTSKAPQPFQLLNSAPLTAPPTPTLSLNGNGGPLPPLARADLKHSMTSILHVLPSSLQSTSAYHQSKPLSTSSGHPASFLPAAAATTTASAIPSIKQSESSNTSLFAVLAAASLLTVLLISISAFILLTRMNRRRGLQGIGQVDSGTFRGSEEEKLKNNRSWRESRFETDFKRISGGSVSAGSTRERPIYISVSAELQKKKNRLSPPNPASMIQANYSKVQSSDDTQVEAVAEAPPVYGRSSGESKNKPSVPIIEWKFDAADAAEKTPNPPSAAIVVQHQHPLTPLLIKPINPSVTNIQAHLPPKIIARHSRIAALAPKDTSPPPSADEAGEPLWLKEKRRLRMLKYESIYSFELPSPVSK